MSSIKNFQIIKRKYGVMLTLFLMVILGAGIVMAMKAPDGKNAKEPTEKKAKVAKKQDNTVWYYISSSSNQSDFTVAGNWATSNNDDECQSTGTRPCQISVAASTPAQLATYLSSQTGSAVLASSTGRKE